MDGALDDAISTIITSRDGRIVELTGASAKLLRVTPRGLARTPWTIALFFDGERHTIFAAQRTAMAEPSDPITGLLRPREGKPRRVSMTVRELEDGYLEWTIRPA